jgi:hypothetical protein
VKFFNTSLIQEKYIYPGQEKKSLHLHASPQPKKIQGATWTPSSNLKEGRANTKNPPGMLPGVLD